MTFTTISFGLYFSWLNCIEVFDRGFIISLTEEGINEELGQLHDYESLFLGSKTEITNVVKENRSKDLRTGNR
jgi:hypothetical protein